MLFKICLDCFKVYSICTLIIRVIESIGKLISTTGPYLSNISFKSFSDTVYGKFLKKIFPDSEISSSFFSKSSCLAHFGFLFCSTEAIGLPSSLSFDDLFFSVKSVKRTCLPSARGREEC